MSNQSDGGVTGAQLRRIFSAPNKTVEQIEQISEQNFGKAYLRHLSSVEASKLIDILEGKVTPAPHAPTQKETVLREDKQQKIEVERNFAGLYKWKIEVNHLDIEKAREQIEQLDKKLRANFLGGGDQK